MVAFSRTPYHEAVSIAKSQENFIKNMMVTAIAGAAIAVGAVAWLQLKAKADK